ncbi:uncharacterized protein Dvir_GJ26596 [Drosophila virilis]|uniref:Uncharacterized protein n=1 Tax=Drosophila virilis TaxID=7244 RepID=A0A0Q9WL54_DROVI|nr:uncharacterized protein Dvir_GJ26596 [Drosophila virilis]
MFYGVFCFLCGFKCQANWQRTAKKSAYQGLGYRFRLSKIQQKSVPNAAAELHKNSKYLR